MTIDDVLYREEILDHADRSPYRGRLESPDFASEMDNPLYGDRLRLELDVGPGGRIERVRFGGHGCVISQAGASLLAERVEGREVDEARRLTPDEALRLFGAALTPARRNCGLLAWRVLRRALEDRERARDLVAGTATIDA
jgi:nitrogen fixation NifU-like protein